MSRNTIQANFEGDLKVLKRNKLSRNHEYGCLLQAVEKFHRDLKLSSLQCKDRNQLNQQWEDQQFYRILVRMMHEVTITTGMKQKEDLKKVYHWYQTNKSVLHSQPHFKGAAAKDIYKRPVLKFAPDALKYYSTPHDRRKQKRVAFDGDGKARTRHQSSRPRRRDDKNLPDDAAGTESEEGRRGGQRPVTAPPGLHRPKVSNSLPKSPESSRPGSGREDASFVAGYVNDRVSAASPDVQMMQRPSSALALIQQSHTYDLDSISGELRMDVSPEDYLASTPSIQSASSVSIHIPHANSQPETSKTSPDSPGQQQALESQSDFSIVSQETDADMAAMLKYRHPIASLVNPVARIQFDEELYDGGQSPDERSKSPVKLQMHVDVPVDTGRAPRVPTADDKRDENLQKWMAFQGRQDYGQEVAAKQSFYGHGGLPTNVRYASHEGGEMPELYTQDVISSYAEADRMHSPQSFNPPVNAIASPSLEDFYELTERHSPQPRPSSRSGKYADVKLVGGDVSDEAVSHSRNGMVLASGKEKMVKFESVVDLADQVGDQLAVQKEKLTPEPRYGYRQPMLRISPAHPRPQSAKQVTASPSPAPNNKNPPPPASPSGPSLAESSKVLFAPPNSSRQSTCSSSDFTPRNKRGDPIILLPEASQYTMHFRRNNQHDSAAYIPHAISKQGRVVPDQQRYSRASSAPGKRSLRSAGSTSAGYRPRTAKTEPSTRHSGSRTKASDIKTRIPQAASHNTASIGPQSLASMMVVNHLGNEQRRGRARMGGPNYYLDEEFESSPPAMEYMSFTGPAKLTTRGQGEKAVSVPTDETHLSDVTPLNPLSQASPLESLPSQDWLYRQGSSEGPEALVSSQGYDDSLNAGSERTDDRSLSQDLGDLDDADDDDDVYNRSQDSQDLGSDLQSVGVTSPEPDGEIAPSPREDVDIGEAADHPDTGVDDADAIRADPEFEDRVGDSRDQSGHSAETGDAETVEAETVEAETVESEEDGPRSEDLVDGHSEAELPVDDLPISRESPALQAPSPSADAVEHDSNHVDSESDRESNFDVSSELSLSEQSAVHDEDQTVDAAHLDVPLDSGHDGHRGEGSDAEARQAPEQILNRHFLAVTRGGVNRPKSANPRLCDPGTDGRNHRDGKGRPSSARVEAAPSVFTIEIDSSRDKHSTRWLQTVPIAYMALTDDHRSLLQQRTLPLVDQQGPPHPMGHHHHAMAPAVTRKPLTPRGSARNSPLASPRGSERGSSPAPSIDVSPAGTRDNSLYSPISSRSGSPVAMVLHAHLDNLEGSGRLESMMPNLMMQMRRPSPSEDEPPEPPASIDDGWSDTDAPHEVIAGQHLSPPRIQIQRPSSAPLSRTDSSPSAANSRPSSARVGRGPRHSTERAPSPGAAMDPTRPRSVVGRGKEWKGRPLPTYGASRDVEANAKAVQMAQEAKSSVNIRELFSGSATKEFRKELERQERERWEKHSQDSKHLNRFYRDYLMRQEIALVQRPDILNRDWARGYISDKMLKDRMRQEKWSEHMRQQALENRKALEQLKRIGPSVDIWELFHGGKRGVTKAQMKKAAVTIQKYVRGWVVRTMLEKVKEKSRVHAGSFKGFVKYYAKLMKRIARWHGVKKPAIHLDLWQMDEFMDRKRYYEYVFAKRAHPNDSITIRDLDGYFKECDHYPSKREIFNAISGATKKDGRKVDAKLSEKEVVEVTFMIYVPQGSTLNQKDTRKSTWLNPLVDGQEAKKLMGSDEVEKAEYAKSLQLVYAAFQERQEKEQAAKERERKKLEEAATAEAASNRKT